MVALDGMRRHMSGTAHPRAFLGTLRNHTAVVRGLRLVFTVEDRRGFLSVNRCQPLRPTFLQRRIKSY